MYITKGLWQGSVIQRDKSDLCINQIGGYCKTKDNIELIVKAQDQKILTNVNTVTKLKFKELEKKGRYNTDELYEFSGVLQGIPVGGSYEVTLIQNNESVTVRDVLVGDVYILAGQSNMEGVAKMSGALSSHPHIRAFYMNDSWGIATDPLHVLQDAIDSVHESINGGPFSPKNPETGVGMGLAFAKSLYEITNVPQGLIACAHGGTSMEQWSPELKDMSGRSLYSALLRRCHYNGSFIKGVLWYQGENDADETSSKRYYERTVGLIKALREDLKYPKLSFVMVQLSRRCGMDDYSKPWNYVQHQQYLIGQEIEHVSVIPSIDLELDDFIHLDAKSQHRLGKRCAQALYALTNKSSDDQKEIKLESIELVKFEDNWNSQIILTYNHVMGELKSNDRPDGFSVSKSEDKMDTNYIFKTELKGNQVILHTTELAIDLKNYRLHYGRGYQPYCNITDAKDRSLPVLYDMPLGDKRVLSEPCMEAWLGDVFKPCRDVESMEGMETWLNKEFEYRNFYYCFLDVYAKCTIKESQESKKVYYYIPFLANEDLETIVLIGGGGHALIYLDNDEMADLVLEYKEIAPDQVGIPLKVDKGYHLFTIEYESSHIDNKGIFLRFEQALVSKVDDELPQWIHV